METLKKIHKNFVGSFAQVGPTWFQYFNVTVGFYGWFEMIYIKGNDLHDYALFYQFLHWLPELNGIGSWLILIPALIPMCYVVLCIGLLFPSFVVVTIWLFIKDKNITWWKN